MTTYFLRVDARRHPELGKLLEAVEIPLGARTTLGRGAVADIVVPHATVSKRHAIFEHDEGGLRVRDAHSTSGIYVDYRRVPLNDSRLLGPGDEIQIGGCYFFVHERRPLPTNDNAAHWLRALASTERDERWTAAQQLNDVHLTSSAERRAMADALRPALADEHEPVRRWIQRALDRLLPLDDEDTIDG